MAAGRYRFHCTDGRHAILDRRGRSIRNGELVWNHAERVAREVMASCGGRLDWSAWQVDAYDPSGRCLMILGFADVRDARRAA